MTMMERDGGEVVEEEGERERERELMWWWLR